MKKPKEEFTEAEQAEIDLYLESELEDSKEAIKAIAKHGRHLKKELKELEKYQRKIERGEIKTRKHGVEVTVDTAMFMNITRLNRAWTPEILQDIYDGLRSPIDLHLYADDFGGADVGPE